MDYRSDVTHGDTTGVNTPAVPHATADTVPASDEWPTPEDGPTMPESVWWRRWVEADRRAFGRSAAAVLPACPTVSESMDLHAAIVGACSALVVIAAAVLTVLAYEKARRRPAAAVQPAGQATARPAPIGRTAVFPAVNHPPAAADPWRWHTTNHNRSPR